MNFLTTHSFCGQTALLMVWVASSAMADPLRLAMSKGLASALV